MCLTPRVNSYTMPTSFDRELKMNNSKINFKFQNETISFYQYVCGVMNIKTNKDIFTSMMDLAFDQSEEMEDGLYLQLLEKIKDEYNIYEKKNILNSPINYDKAESTFYVHWLASNRAM